MTEVLQWGLELIAWIQSYRTPVLDEFMRQITKFGGRYYIYLVPFIVWSLNFRFSLHICFMFLLSFFVNMGFKDALAHPRPFDLDPGISPDREYGYGLPSGHAQNSALLWIMLAAGTAKKWFWVLALAMALLIGLSRVYLGVHFPTDVIGGWFLAAVLLWCFYVWRGSVAQWMASQSVVHLIFILAVVMTIFSVVYVWLSESPVITILVALSFGFGVGAIISSRVMGYSGHGHWWQRLLRYLLGMVVLMAYMKFAAGLLPDEKNTQYYLTLFLANVAGGLWLSLGAPALFMLCGLSSRAETSSEKEVVPLQN